MDDKEVGKFWDKNAENWTKLSRMGYDKCRDLINAPAFFKMLPEIANLKGLDIGCGEGYNTRIASKTGAIMVAIDISEKFIAAAKEFEVQEPLGIKYQVASAVDLPFPNEFFDFAMATMSLMDIADTEKAISEAYRVIKPKGFFQFSITHPCFTISNLGWVKNEEGKKTGLVVSDYFKKSDGEIEEWIFGAAPTEMTDKMRKFKIPRFKRILSDWLNLLIRTGFVLEEFCEPYPEDEVLEKYPEEYVGTILPFFLIIRCRKP
ncbi:MAG: class I SAM-dependent methyltransferase [Candidatus Lokiarchaeota archaeon]|nr:class I SAM-dependent methyltransferase [Candidatus Lokiarchaeota archaeon]